MLLGAVPGALLAPGASEPSKLLLHDLVEIPLGVASLSEPWLEIDRIGLGGAFASPFPFLEGYFD